MWQCVEKLEPTAATAVHACSRPVHEFLVSQFFFFCLVVTIDAHESGERKKKKAKEGTIGG